MHADQECGKEEHETKRHKVYAPGGNAECGQHLNDEADEDENGAHDAAGVEAVADPPRICAPSCHPYT